MNCGEKKVFSYNSDTVILHPNPHKANGVIPTFSAEKVEPSRLSLPMRWGHAIPARPLRILSFFLAQPVQQLAEAHDRRKDDQIPQATPAMAENTGDYHEDVSAYGEGGENEPPQNVLLFLLAHPLNHDGKIHQIDGNDGQLLGIKHKGSGPCAGKIGQVKIAEPCSHQQQTHDGGIAGHPQLFDFRLYLVSQTSNTGSGGYSKVKKYRRETDQSISRR